MSVRTYDTKAVKLTSLSSGNIDGFIYSNGFTPEYRSVEGTTLTLPEMKEIINKMEELENDSKETN